MSKLPNDDDVHAGDVNSETPPVHKATNIETAEKNTPAREKDINTIVEHVFGTEI